VREKLGWRDFGCSSTILGLVVIPWRWKRLREKIWQKTGRISQIFVH